MRVNLFSTTAISAAQRKYLDKDQSKAAIASKFIGRGNGATGEYARIIGEAGYPVNYGEYDAHDVVFVSANGNRKGRMAPDLEEIGRAVDAGARIVTDARNRRPEGGNPYNIGEQEVADYLRSRGYIERKVDGVHPDVAVWHPVGWSPEL